MQLTEHFNLAEFTRSATAGANGLDNSLDVRNADDRRVIENLRNLCVQVLEPLREFVGGPVIISSGYRCKELNRLVGGASSSQHMTGEAVDIVISAEAENQRETSRDARRASQERLKECFLFIQNNCCFDQLILESRNYKRWIHVSCLRDVQKNRMMSRTMKIGG